MNEISWFILGSIIGIVATILVKFLLNYIRNQKNNRDDLKTRNMKKLSMISLLFYFSYIVSLLLAYPLGSYINPFIGWFFLAVIVLLALIGVFAIYLVKDNYEAEEEGSPELFSLGETLISVTLQLLLGSVTLGILLMLLNVATGS